MLVPEAKTEVVDDAEDEPVEVEVASLWLAEAVADAVAPVLPAEVVCVTAELLLVLPVEAVTEPPAIMVDEGVCEVLEAVPVALETDEDEDDDPVLCKSLHVSTSRTASFPFASLIGVSTTTQVCVIGPAGL